MIESKVRIGIVGAGGSRAMYAPIVRRVPGMDLVAVVDPDPRARRAAMSELGVRGAFESIEEMIRTSKPEGIIVSSPVLYHVSHVLQAARMGLHVFVEKPMARTPAEARQMIDACRSAGVLLMVGFNRRRLPPLWTATEMVKSGTLGEVFHVECIWTHCGNEDYGWRDSSECLGGVFQDHGSHTMDLCRQWLGEPRTVHAMGRRGTGSEGHGRGVEDHLAALVTHDGGRSSYHMNARDSHRPISEFYRLYGTRGTLELEYTGQWAFAAPDNWDIRLYRHGEPLPQRLVSRRPGDELLSDIPDGHYAFYAELKSFVQAIASKSTSVTPSGEDGLLIVRAVAAAFISAAENRVVDVQDADRFDQEAFARYLESITHAPRFEK